MLPVAIPARPYRERRSSYKKGLGWSAVQCVGPLASDPPPPLCNRSGVPWRTKAAPCECDKWPEWINRHRSSSVCQPVSSGTLKDGKVLHLPRHGAPSSGANITTIAAYWRPGSHKEFFYYNAKVTSIYKVKYLLDPSAGAGGGRQMREVEVFEVN